MQMIIVDDEAHWVDNLSMTKPWHTLGIEQVHRAYSAREALQLIETQPIDIVISDIQMPEMTGIELIERIRIRDKKIKCILLSGYSEFDYAKKAIQYEAVDYLLKPPTDDELIGAVQKAIDQLNNEWALVSSLSRTQFTLRENLPHLRGRLLLEALQGHRFSASEWERKLDNYDLPFRTGDAALMLVRMDNEFSQYDSHDQTLIEYAIINMAEEIMGEFMQVWGVKEEHGYVVFLLQLKERSGDIGKETILEKLSIQLQSKVKQFLKGSLSIVMTEWFTFPEQIYDRFRQASAYFRQIVGDEREFVMRVTDVEAPAAQGPLDVLYTPPTFIQLLESGQWDAAEEKYVPSAPNWTKNGRNRGNTVWRPDFSSPRLSRTWLIGTSSPWQVSWAVRSSSLQSGEVFHHRQTAQMVALRTRQAKGRHIQRGQRHTFRVCEEDTGVYR